MDLKVVSGVLITKDIFEGEVVIDYSRNEIVSGDLDVSKLRQEKMIAPLEKRTSYFDSSPCYIVSLRQIHTTDVDSTSPIGSSSVTRIATYMVDSESTSTRLTIEWKGKIEEISYMAIGPVSLPPAGPI